MGFCLLNDNVDCRAVRPKHRDRGERNSSTSAIPSTSSAIHNVASSSSSGSSPTPSHSVPEASSSYHCEDESGSGYNSGDEYGPARSSNSNLAISEEEWEQVINKLTLTILKTVAFSTCLITNTIFRKRDGSKRR